MSIDNPFPDGSHVLVRYPAPGQPESDPRESWAWREAVIEERCGHDEWVVTVTAPELGDDPDFCSPESGGEQNYLCFRSASEIRPAAPQDIPAARAGQQQEGKTR